MTEVALVVPTTVKRDVPGAFVVFSALSKVSVRVAPSTVALLTVGGTPVRFVTCWLEKSATWLPDVSCSGLESVPFA